MFLSSKHKSFEVYFSGIDEVEQDLIDAESTKSDKTGTTKLPASEIVRLANDSNQTKSGARSFDDPFGNPGFK